MSSSGFPQTSISTSSGRNICIHHKNITNTLGVHGLNGNGNSCTYQIVSWRFTTLLWSEIGNHHLKAPLAAAISPNFFSHTPNQTKHECGRQMKSAEIQGSLSNDDGDDNTNDNAAKQ